MLLALACCGTPQRGAGLWVQAQPSDPISSRRGPLEAAVAPVHSPELQFQISEGAEGLGGRGLQSEREDLNEKAGCGEGARLFPPRLGGFCWLLGRSSLGGEGVRGFSAPRQGFGVGVTGANNSEPEHFGGCISAEDSEDSFTY